MMRVLILLVLSFISGLLYRFGGSEKRGDKWDFLRRSITRDLGCSLLITLGINVWLGWMVWWASIIHFGLLWGALSTYWDWLNKERKVWWTWLITGAFYGLACLPFLWDGLPIFSLLLRVVVLGVSTMAWRLVWKWDIAEEFGVGVLLGLTIFLL
jgi:hypothetical protein